MATRTLPNAEMPAKPSLFREFREFLDKYGVVGLAIAFIIGAALTSLVQALVTDIITPLLKPLFATLGDDWKTAETNLGPFGPFRIGHFADALIYFLIIAVFVFLVAKYVLREQTVAKR
ncbi:MAG TPA: MscL family protein [Candidatus Thermoplasmatota archaeon]|nr:MscL family protein [Candidatus Thermoplasmatota archaeon]